MDLADKDELPKEFKDSKDQAFQRHEALKRELEQKVALKEKLARRFKSVYAVVRFVLVTMWLGPLYVLYRLGIVINVEDALNYSQASFFILLILNFITFGSLTNLNDFLGVIKLRVENWVWSKHLNLSDDILAKNQELETLAISLQTIPASSETSEIK
ncbi:MAG: hypothetical protein ACOYXT_03940 [Bacteroidota bacterium]